MDVYSPLSSAVTVLAAQEQLSDYLVDIAARSIKQVGLYANNVTPNVNLTLANLTEASFGGYARITATPFTAIGRDPQGNSYATTPLLVFQANGNAPSNLIYGAFLVATKPGGTTATATNAGNGSGGYDTDFNVTNAGAGYEAAPPVTITGADGIGASAHAVINASGQVTSLVLDAAGSGYTTYTLTMQAPVELVKISQLSQTGIAMGAATNQLVTFMQVQMPPATM